MHQYCDNSNTFEIIEPRSVSCCGDDNEIVSEIMFVAANNDNMGIFNLKFACY